MRIAVVVFEGFDELDAIGPLEVLRNAAAMGADDLSVDLVTLDGTGEVTGSHGLRVRPDGPLDPAQLLRPNFSLGFFVGGQVLVDTLETYLGNSLPHKGLVLVGTGQLDEQNLVCSLRCSYRQPLGRPWVLCCIRVSMGEGTSFGSDLLQALNLCLSCCYVTPEVTPFAQTHPTPGRCRL